MIRSGLAALALSVTLLGGTGSPAQQQPPSQEQLTKQRDEKLQAAFFKNATWTTDYDAALAAAKQRNVPIFAYFTRSYAKWGPCDALEGSALSDASLAEFGKKVVLFCHITSRVETDKYQDLLKEKGGRGFPHLVFMDSAGKVLTKQRDRSVKGFAATLGRLETLAAAKQKADAGDAAAKLDVLLAELDLGCVSTEDARTRSKDLGVLNRERALKLEDALTCREVLETAEGVGSKEQSAAAGAKFAVMKSEGRIPANGDAQRTYWHFIMVHAEGQKDATLYEEALGCLKKLIGDDAQMKRALDRYEATLKKLKGGS